MLRWESNDESSIEPTSLKVSEQKKIHSFPLNKNLSDLSFMGMEGNQSFDLEDFINGQFKLDDLNLIFASPRVLSDFRTNSLANGIIAKGEIPELGVLRIGITDYAKAWRYLNEISEDEVSLSLNHGVRLPKLPKPTRITGDTGFGDSAFEYLGVPEERKQRGRGIKVAIIDSGVDPTHPDLTGISLKSIRLGSKEGGEGSFMGHGTAIASIIGSQKADRLGLAPSAEILSVEVLDEYGEGSAFDVAEGIVRAVDERARVINLSLGGDYGSPVLANAIAYAQSQGAVVVAAVGNDGLGQVAFPARYDGVIGVSTIDAMGRISSFSNYGEGVDIAAPGVFVDAAWEEGDYVSFSGTSASAAFVSGAIAAEWSVNPNMSDKDMINIIYDYANEAEKPGTDEFTGNGILNVGRISRRMDSQFSDVSVVGYYFEPEDLKGGGTTPFLVTIQNQGNSWLREMELSVSYEGLTRKYPVSSLNPGETRSERFFLNRSTSKKPLIIESKVILKNGEDDLPENNFRRSEITLP